MDWDSAYRGAGAFEGPPPWNIGEPQPALAALIEHTQIADPVLDAGCGHAELGLSLAARGHTVVGIDLAPTAIAAATAAAAERGLQTTTFVCADITGFTGYDGFFATIIDCTLFHSLPVDRRDAYLASIYRAAAPGARFYALVFDKGAFPAQFEGKPNDVTAEELRQAVASYFTVDEIRPAAIHAYAPQIPGAPPEAAPALQRDAKGRVMFPAHLLTAHKAT